MKKSIYIAGKESEIARSDGFLSPESANWRSSVIHFCMKNSIQVTNPLAELKEQVNTNGKSFISTGARGRKEIEKILTQIEMSDFLLANLHNADESSWIPLIHAHNRGKITIAWTPFPINIWMASYVKASFERLEGALEYIYNQTADNMTNIIDWSINFELGLNRNSDIFPKDGEAEFHSLSGKPESKVILLAPHATSYWQTGLFRQAEKYTGSLVASLNRLTENHAIISSYCSPEDSLYSSSISLHNPLLCFLSKLRESHDLKLILVFRSNSDNSKDKTSLKTYYTGNKSDYIADFEKNLSALFSDRNISHKFTDTSEDDLLMRLSENFRLPIVEIDIHRLFLLPQIYRMYFHDLLVSLEIALNSIN